VDVGILIKKLFMQDPFLSALKLRGSYGTLEIKIFKNGVYSAL
jgi:hypothetical protein